MLKIVKEQKIMSNKFSYNNNYFIEKNIIKNWLFNFILNCIVK